MQAPCVDLAIAFRMTSISDSSNKAVGTVITIVYVCMHVCDVSPVMFIPGIILKSKSLPIVW